MYLHIPELPVQTMFPNYFPKLFSQTIFPKFYNSSVPPLNPCSLGEKMRPKPAQQNAYQQTKIWAKPI